MDKQDKIIQLLSKSYNQHIKNFKDLVANQQTFVDNQAVLSNNIKDNTKAINNAMNQIRITGNNINRTNNQILAQLQKNNQNSSASGNDDVIQQLKENGKYNAVEFKYFNTMMRMMFTFMKLGGDMYASTRSMADKMLASYKQDYNPKAYRDFAKIYMNNLRQHKPPYDFTY